jgi:hypothetical protein
LADIRLELTANEFERWIGKEGQRRTCTLHAIRFAQVLSRHITVQGTIMNEWDERIRAHRVWTEMKTLGPIIDRATAAEDLAPETVAGLGRIRAVLAYCGKRLAAADPIITLPQPLDTITNNLVVVQNELTAFVSDKDPAHVVTANGAADAALLPIAQIPGAYSSEELGALVATATEYRTTIQQALTNAKKQVQQFNSVMQESLAKLSSASEESRVKLDARLEDSSKGLTATTESLQASLTALAASIQAEQQKLAQIVSDQQGQFSTAQEARSKEFTEGLRLAVEGYTRLVTDYQGQFSVAQDTRSKEYAAAELARQNKYNETIAEFSKKLADQDTEFTKQRTAVVTASELELAGLVSEYRNDAAKIVEDIEEKQKHVEKLVGVIGNLGVTSGYLRVANQARWALWGWQATTLTALVTLSWLAYKTLGALEDSSGHFTWGGFAARALLLVSLGVIAAYSGTQADKLFGEERRNRKLALELEAIGPYLAPLPVEEQNKFRLQIGELSFGRDPEPHVHRKSPASIADLLNSKETKDFLKLLIEAGVKAKDLK